jgi:hypothetical protein
LGATVFRDHDSKMLPGVKTIKVDFLSEGIYFAIIGWTTAKTVIRFVKLE